MIITVFGDVRVRPGMEVREERLANHLAAIARAMPGFVSIKGYTGEDGEEIGIIRFTTREALDAWMNEGEHFAAQKMGADLYDSFWVQSAETFRDYTWKDGIHTDRDLADLFAETRAPLPPDPE
jgi:heme-degrading monooxygenase HmoA